MLLFPQHQQIYAYWSLEISFYTFCIKYIFFQVVFSIDKNSMCKDISIKNTQTIFIITDYKLLFSKKIYFNQCYPDQCLGMLVSLFSVQLCVFFVHTGTYSMLSFGMFACILCRILGYIHIYCAICCVCVCFLMIMILLSMLP